MSKRKRPSNVLLFPEPTTPPRTPHAYTVENDVPPPQPPRAISRKYPLAGMEVGQSFSAPIGDWNRICCAARSVARTKGFKFTTRKVNDLKIRVWRME